MIPLYFKLQNEESSIHDFLGIWTPEAPKYAVNLGPMGALGLESRENEILRFEILTTAESS